MSNQRAYVVMAARAHCDYPVAVFDARDPAELYAGWCNRAATFADYRVVDVPANPMTMAMHAEMQRRAQEKTRTF